MHRMIGNCKIPLLNSPTEGTKANDRLPASCIGFVPERRNRLQRHQPQLTEANNTRTKVFGNSLIKRLQTGSDGATGQALLFIGLRGEQETNQRCSKGFREQNRSTKQARDRIPEKQRLSTTPLLLH